MANQIDWSKWRCRCSSISKIMANSRDNPPLTEKQEQELKKLEEKTTRTPSQELRITELVLKRENSKDVVLSDTCIQYLTEAYAWEVFQKFNVTKELDIEYMQKGREVEDESIELLSFVRDRPYSKNEDRIENDFLSGHPDVFSGEKLKGASYITDMKNCWSLPGFLYKIHKGLDDGYSDQVGGYGDICECGNLSVTYALVNTPESIRNGYKFRLASKLNLIDVDHTQQWKQIESSMIFDGDIPHYQRIYEIPIEPFTKDYQSKIYDRIKHARDWLNNFHELYLKLNQ